MADTKKGIKEGEAVGPPLVQSTTEATPSPADETSMPNHLNTENEQPPVRTSSPDTPIAQTLTAGAGEHTPPDPAVFDRDGRPRAVSGVEQGNEPVNDDAARSEAAKK